MFKSMLDYDYRRALAFAFCMFIAIGCTQTLAEGQTVDPGLEAERNKTVPDTAPKAPTPDELEPLVSQMAKWPALYDCGKTDQVLAIVTGKYGEQPMIVGMGVIQIPNGQILKAPVLVYFNKETTTFSLVSHFENAYSCIMTSGDGLQPARGSAKPTQKQQNKPFKPGTYEFSDKLDLKINLIQNDNLDFLVLR